MGMHFGILAAPCPWCTLQAALASHGAALQETQPAVEPYWWIEAGEYQGRAYLLDGCYPVSNSPDLLVALSRTLPGDLVSHYAETVSGSFGLVVANGGHIRRLYHASCESLSEPLSIGELFLTESMNPLDGIGGGLEVLRHLGYDYDGFWESGTKQPYDLGVDVEFPGPLQDRIDEHTAKFAIPKPQRQKLCVISWLKSLFR